MRRRLGLPPRRPPGWRIGPPDFVGVGTQRSGTTWWYRLVTDHPQIAAGEGKEHHYFDPFVARAFTDRDEHGYHRMFPRPAGVMIGEWTPRYMYDLWTPALLSRCAPQARILVQLRDPWARYRSGLGHESRALERALRRRNGDYVRQMIFHDALSRSLYARQLSTVLNSFARSQILILQYERCIEDTLGELRRTYEFLGVDPSHQPNLPPRAGSRRHPAVELPEHIESSAREQIALDASSLPEVAPELDLGLWPSCA